ncbi:DUF1232 domain-containing protein [Sphingobacterium oryzagri]|uniref:DUF1232 domain-containing protein n=1 Tax=Sphingobacterium oryzagri TaxID=3025669 RepID=A0ABY7WPA3_9SPHI|nr:DUF1232 domain-containing protein [Sphingobacterium sp. KACC 22765]WDF70241.1 DUF1232 domain-containing protein [Sphingobacterium sp. KACC 22765]
MKKMRWMRALQLFEQFRKVNITGDDLDRAEGKAANLNEKVGDFKLLIAMGRDSLAGRYKMNKWNLSVVVGTVVYVLSPLDAIPDVVPVLGWLDDVTIVGYAIGKLSVEMRKYKQHREQQQSATVVQ